MKEGSRLLALLYFALTFLLFSGADTPLKAEQDSLLIKIDWKAPDSILFGDGTGFKSLNHQDVVFIDGNELPYFQVILQNVIVKNFYISNLEYEDFSDEELELTKKFADKALPAPSLQIKYQSKSPISYIYIPSIAKEPSHQKLQKLISYSVIYDLEIKNNNGQNARKTGIINSVLSTGSWYKFAVPQKGIYKITYDQLKEIGISVDNIDPRQLKVFGNGGGMLPQKNDSFRNKDLVENAIFVSGEENGKFSKEDFILFFGQGSDKIQYNPTVKNLEYEKNIYSDSTYYFLTVEGSQGLRIGNNENLGESFILIDYFDDYIVHEKDLNSPNKSGREWFGEHFGTKSSYDFKFPAQGLRENSNISIICKFLTWSYVPSSYTVSLNSLDLATVDLGTVLEGRYIERGVVGEDSLSVNSSLINLVDNHLNIKLSYNRTTSISTAYLDYLLLSFQRKISLYNNQTFFRSIESTNNLNTTFKVDGLTPSSTIWDVTDPLNPYEQDFKYNKNLGLFGVPSTDLKEFAVFDANHLPAPQFIEKIPNQNLQGEGSFDMVIVTHENFKEEALRLATYREAQAQLTVKVVTVKEIYNEFSSGSKDVTAIRDYMKYLYDLKGSGEGIKYLLLFGKGSFDIKNKIPGNINLVPIYGSRNSLHPIYSYSSDDYYGFLDDGEGEWVENNSGDHLMDIGIGRLPVRNSKEAKLIVDKIIHYESSQETLGAWRKEIVFVADDGDFNLHQLDADKLANLVDTVNADFNVNKIYLDAYPQIDYGNNFQSAPEVNKAINDAIKSGAFIVNYTGHGGLTTWADERILENDMISKWKNHNKLPFFVTATCNFGQHDEAVAQSSGEKMLLDIKGGAIGLITSSRPVFSSTNYALNLSFYNHVFKKVDGHYLTLGEIFKEVKNTSLKGSINRNFSLLGDPSMKLSYPSKNIQISSVTNGSSTGVQDTLKALGKVKIKGHVTDNAGDIENSFNGLLYASIFDKLYPTTTLGSPSMTFRERNSTLFRGKVSVVDGLFEFDFVVPKNISYDFNEGKISLYAIDENNGIDAKGSNQNLKIGGSDPEAMVDRTPPQIKLYLNDTTFRNGAVTASNSLFIAKIYDENGINITNNFNHQLTATLNDDKVYILNDFFESDIDNYKLGWVNYPIDDLPKGKNSIKLTVWDTHNNVSESTLEFYVDEDAKLAINNVINYPNPFSEKTKFQFDHNAAGENLLIRIDIYSIQGEHVNSIENHYATAASTIRELEWDGSNFIGQRQSEGVYIYKVSIFSETTGLKNQKFKRLIFKN